MLQLLQHPLNTLDAHGNLVSTSEMALQLFVIHAKRARNAHEMVLYSKVWRSTPEALDFWIAEAMRARNSAHEWAARYREQLCKEAFSE